MVKKLTGSDMIKHISTLKSKRNEYDDLFNDVKYWLQPGAGDFYSNHANTPGQKVDNHIYNPKGTQAAERLSHVLYSTVFPSHEHFFTLVPSTEANHDAKLWWHQATEILSNSLSESNLPSIAMQALRSLVYYGTAPVYTTFENDSLSYATYFPEDCYIDLNYDKVVNVLVTSLKCSAHNLVGKYGPSQVSTKVNELSKKSSANGADEVVVYNYFTECDNGEWRLYIVEEDTRHIITEYSFTSNPIQVPRWSTNSHETYGRSPSMRAVPSIQTLNRIEATILRQSEKHVDPPIAIPYDSTAGAMKLSMCIEPRGVIDYQESSNGTPMLPHPIVMGGNIEVGQYQVDKLESFIDDMFFTKELTLISNMSEVATATQINAANAEKLDIVMPVIVQILADLVKPLIERSFQILLDEGVIPAPDYLMEGEEFTYDVEVQSSLVMKRRQIQAELSIQTVGVLNSIAQMDPATVPEINLGALREHLIINSNLPTTAIRSGRELEEFKLAMAQAQEEAQAKQMMAQMVKPIDAQKASDPGSIGDSITGLTTG